MSMWGWMELYFIYNYGVYLYFNLLMFFKNLIFRELCGVLIFVILMFLGRL